MRNVISTIISMLSVLKVRKVCGGSFQESAQSLESIR